MDIRDYEYIVAIAENASISRAAGQLFITQSALTRFLQRTEKLTGVPLFHRQGNQFLLTAAGQHYVETGRAIMQLDRKLSDKLAEEKMLRQNLIRLGFSMGRSDYLMKRVFPRFFARFPDIEIKSKGNTSYRSMEALQHGDMDMVLVTNAKRLPGYSYIPVEKSCMALTVRTDSPLVAEGRELEGYPFPAVPAERLRGLRMVTMPVSTNSGNLTREIIDKYQLGVRICLEVSDVRSLIDAVAGGLGIAMMMTVPAIGDRVRYLSLEGVELPEQTVELVYRSDKAFTPGMKYLASLLTGREDGPNSSLRQEDNDNG